MRPLPLATIFISSARPYGLLPFALHRVDIESLLRLTTKSDCVRAEPHSSFYMDIMAALAPILTRLGLSQYLDRFVTEGFDTWETLLDITESDLYGQSPQLAPRCC